MLTCSHLLFFIYCIYSFISVSIDLLIYVFICLFYFHINLVYFGIIYHYVLSHLLIYVDLLFFSLHVTFFELFCNMAILFYFTLNGFIIIYCVTLNNEACFVFLYLRNIPLSWSLLTWNYLLPPNLFLLMNAFFLLLS